MKYRTNLGVNFERAWEFEMKFKREPRQWSFEQLHDLYVRAKERAVKRRKEFSDFIDYIIEVTEPNEKGEHLVYFNINSSEHTTYRYCLRKDSEFGWSYSTDRVSFSKDTVLARNEKIEFLLNNETRFELGEKLKKLEKMKSSFDHHIFYIIGDAVNDKLCKKFKNVKNHDVPKVLKVKISDITYYVALTKESRSSGYNWKSFEILGQEDNSIIELDFVENKF